MKKYLLTFLLVVFVCGAMSAQTVLPQWLFISAGETIYAVEQGVNNGNLSQTDFLKQLLNEARLNVSKQVSVHIASEEILFQQSLNGTASTRYFSSSRCSTDASMHLLRTDSHYDVATKKGAAIAWFDKAELRTYWSGVADKTLLDFELAVDKVEKMIRMGYKEKAKEQLAFLQGQFSKMDEPLVWLRTAACSQSVWQGFMSRFESVVKRMDDAVLSLGHGIAICIEYQSDCFGEPYLPLLNNLKSKLASSDRSFVSEAWDADWVVRITAAARDANTFSIDGRTAYFSFVDATMEIVKVATAQSVYSNSWAMKGGDTGSYKKAAIEAFGNLLKPMYDAIEQNIKE